MSMYFSPFIPHDAKSTIEIAYRNPNPPAREELRITNTWQSDRGKGYYVYNSLTKMTRTYEVIWRSA